MTVRPREDERDDIDRSPSASMTPVLAATSTPIRALRVMLVDDHASFRASARWLLETEGCVVVAEAASGEHALDLVAQVEPELVLLDIGLPGIDGFEVAAAIRARFPGARVVLTSSRDLSDLGPARVRACGAAGFVPKAALSRAALVGAGT
jgi:DNA-binding NarL/FixJ family response regulator